MKLNFKQTTLVLATTLALGVSSMANATTITNVDGTFSFSGFDWSKAGQGWVSDYDITSLSAANTSDVFHLNFQATAVAVFDGAGNAILGASAPGLGTTYEYTIFASITETATCILSGGVGNTCSAVSFSNVSGSYSIYYDTTVGSFANYALGTGFVDGTKILGGNIYAASPVLVPQGPTNPGNASVSPALYGDVTNQNTTYIDPLLTFTNATSTLQFGSSQSLPWSRALAFDGVATGPDSNTSYQGQMDANQSFSAIPEPASLALFGLGLLGLVGVRRRHAK